MCGERFPTSDALRYHRVKSHEKPSFFCQICGKCYKRVGELNTHIKRAHNDRRKAEVCNYCGKEYYDRSGLRNHLVSKHDVPQEMTYSENYLRKKRVDGLPLAKHIEKKAGNSNSSSTTVFLPSKLVNPTQVVHDEEVSHTYSHGEELHSQPSQLVMSQGQHLVVDEVGVANRSLGAYQEITTSTNDDDNSLVVTEITEVPSAGQVEQTMLVEPTHGMIIHHDQLTHVQQGTTTMPMHHPMHQQMQHHHAAMSRLGVLYHMNMHHPSTTSPHINM